MMTWIRRWQAQWAIPPQSQSYIPSPRPVLHYLPKVNDAFSPQGLSYIFSPPQG